MTKDKLIEQIFITLRVVLDKTNLGNDSHLYYDFCNNFISDLFYSVNFLIDDDTKNKYKETTKDDKLMQESLKEKPLRYTELKNKIIKLRGYSSRTADNIICSSKKNAIIAKDINNKYRYVGYIPSL